MDCILIIQDTNTENRIEWIDFAKGIAILLVIIGHCVYTHFFGQLARGLIFSFHMPLFFIVSCATTKWSDSLENYLKKLKKSAIHLLIPVLITFIFLTIVACIKDTSLILNLSWWKQRAFTLFFASGYKVSFAGMEIAALGIPWFMIVLFIGRSIFDYLHMRLSGFLLALSSLLIGAAGVALGYIQFLPFSFDVALAVMPFLYFGYRLKDLKLDIHPVRKMFLWLVVWLVTLYLTYPHYDNRTYLEFAVRRYSLVPVSYLCAIAGTLFVLEFSVICCRLKHVTRPLIYLGKNSLYLYIIHSIDSTWSVLYHRPDHQFITALLAVLCDLVAFCILMIVRKGCLIHKKKQKKI